ncbi:sirohydrochlorin chelatase [Aciduricibacillus chroicocephali]|uniref:Sirohydrochlorin chelatase n=1 Tax=Aciduricibacillus chroicocephali TaxID=3054939 RepID=A0ABY9KWD9_9BACI|nr:sirohydrochlorin chelatase [Bacillaceae bacterium 44XB]
MEAVLYIGHGTRVPQGVAEALDFIDRGKEGVEAPIQESCFLELVEPDILEGIKRCVDRGATCISVVPILLLTAMHAKKDIPDELKKAQNLYPHIEFKYGRPFGIHKKITNALLDRVKEKGEPGYEDMVLLVGRGSSDPEVKRDLTSIAEDLQSLHPFKEVAISFMYGAKPKLREALLTAQESGAKRVFIVPYLLFSGLVMYEIEEELEKLPDSEQEFILCESLGYHPSIAEVLQERANELLDSKTAFEMV